VTGALGKELLVMFYYKEGYRKLENYMEAVSCVTQVDGVYHTSIWSRW
jgi:hypothetical protein